jgi:hypothetical protein
MLVQVGLPDKYAPGKGLGMAQEMWGVSAAATARSGVKIAASFSRFVQ